MLSIDQLVRKVTEQEVLDSMLQLLTEIGFITAKSWQDGSVRKTMMRGFARTSALLTNGAAEMVDAAYLHPRGAWQDLVGRYWYAKPRLEATRTRRNIILTSSPSAPPHVIAVGSVVETTTGIAFRTIVPMPPMLSPGGSVTLLFEALEPGEAGNLAPVPMRLVTPYAGVTAVLTPSVITPGTERESDARYQFRLDRRWQELTYAVGLRAYEARALEASGAVRRVRATNDIATREVTVWIDAPLGTDVTVANFLAPMVPPNETLDVQFATLNAQTIAASPRIKLGTTTVADIEAAWDAYLDAMPIGGVRVAGAPAGRLLREGLTKSVLCGLPGVESVNLTTPAADVIMGASEIIDPTYVIAPEWVP